MALLGPLCARNYAAPRFAMLLVLLCDLPFVAGAVLSDEPLLSLIALMTPAFLVGAMLILAMFHDAMLTTLEAKEENKRLAIHDSLTGIFNRQGMDEALGTVVAQSGRTMALLSIDLDGFKQVNDTHGHGAGDLILIEVARRIRANVRETDFVARMGGDEFMVVLRNIDQDAIPFAADALIEAISDEPVAISHDTVATIGASIGYACLPQDATTTVELRLRADRALYAAKDAGKGTARRYRSNALSSHDRACQSAHLLKAQTDR
ncbi:GGDEF domain-containing protein [uncultured Jannaschia sp.]|uniref:GGDEF domain-containing protein n=1 Tax=uncultured Jannaschia sp. TaxID=293347 RepID=UPI002613BB3A|nr:GGDEF domain-containing protein [uncultured Jannaschia sp.]